MMPIIVGIDPDSDKSGCASFVDGKLVALDMFNTIEIIENFVKPVFVQGDVLFSIEDVCANNYLYEMKLDPKLSAQSKDKIKQNRMLKVGRCQQAQIELMRWLDHYKRPYVLHPPQKGNWADNKKIFEMATGWKGKSNADTRSAAFMGMLEIQSKRK
jgi:hypothetical protein